MSFQTEGTAAVMLEMLFDVAGVSVTYIPQGGAPFTLRALIGSRDTMGELAGQQVGTDLLVFEALLSDLPATARGDLIDYEGVRYQVTRKPAPDALGQFWRIWVDRAP